MLDDTFDDVYALSTLSGKVPREQFERVIIRSPNQSFLFSSTIGSRDGQPVRVVRTSSETFATVTKIAIARHLRELPRFGENWLAHYLLYMRKTADGEEIIDPLRASGMIANGLTLAPEAPDFSNALRQGINDTYALMTFMVAHEFYHLEHPATCSDDSPACLASSRADEAAADVYATAILDKLAKQDGSEAYQLGIPCYLFAQLMLVMEGVNGRTPILPGSHPPTHERLRNAALSLKGWTEANAASPAAEDLRAMADYSLGIAARIDAETPAKYFAGVDEEAATVTLQSLKLY
jgi:hypothetical protein